MQRRILVPGLLAAAFAVTAAACSDENPTLSGDDQFPPGSISVTREVLVPASQFLRILGSYTGYTTAADAQYLEVAQDYQGLNAHGLSDFFGFPRTVTYQRDGVAKTDSAFTYADSRLVLRVDTANSTSTPIRLRVYQNLQAWDPGSATWTNAVDTAGQRTPWVEPGGTRGALIGEATRAAGGDSVVFTVPAATVLALSRAESPGIIITGADADTRVRVSSISLRAAVQPDSATNDTTIITPVSSGPRAILYTPEQPDAPAGVLAAGGIRSARTLFEMDPDQPVPGCASGLACPSIPLSQVELNSVALLLRPREVPNGFGVVGSLPLSLRRVSEPELGRFAPLGATEGDAALAVYEQGDTLVTFSITRLAFLAARPDTLPNTFALVSEAGTSGPATFGAAFFETNPMLRIVYTLPARRRLP